ncbi:hypothetical protein MPSEU_000432700 [Mayamaea pseudoterrestris]|nr:hypothetical protein MPSEU_000432700 [Mayamaea pseudoterrestris]
MSPSFPNDNEESVPTQLIQATEQADVTTVERTCQEVLPTSKQATKTEKNTLSRSPCENVAPPSPFASSSWNNACLNARVLFATDEWFASADNLLNNSDPFFDPEAFCEQGKVMDGWETRRRREAGHDWCLLQLDSCYEIHAVEIDTAHFTGNNTPAVSLQMANANEATISDMARDIPCIVDRLLFGCVQGTGATPTQVAQAEATLARPGLEWETTLPMTRLQPGYQETRMHYFTLDQPVKGTVVRLNYFPDGGVARLRLWGSSLDSAAPRLLPAALYYPITTGPTCTVVPHASGQVLSSHQQGYAYAELSSMELGGVGLACSNKHYGDPWNLIQPTLGKDMGDGWETARHPNRPSVWVKDDETGLLKSTLKDWCILKLGHAANSIGRIILDTKHFRGNYPESVQVEGCFATDDDNLLCPATDGVEWFNLVSRCRMAPDSEHLFDLDQILNREQPVSHLHSTSYG